MPPSEILVVLVGDRAVGKTTMITAVTRGGFEANVAPLIPGIKLPQDIAHENCTVHIRDTSLRAQEDQTIARDIRDADVLCVVCAIDNPQSISNLGDYWLPLIERERAQQPCPVILVGNKMDKTSDPSQSTQRMNQGLKPVMTKYLMCEAYIECSAKTMDNIADVFFYAQKAVLFPIKPVYDMTTRSLTPAFMKALRRVFVLCDEDKDNLLNDRELYNFQSSVFNTPLSSQELAEIKAVTERNRAGGIENNCFTREGFFFLQELFILKGRLETTWRVLRTFGYDDNLELFEDYIHPPLDMGRDCTTEISADGEGFLLSLYDKFAEADGTLTPDNLTRMFEICPRIPWDDDIYHDGSDIPMSKARFLALWAYTCWRDPEEFLAMMAYLGFCPCSESSDITAANALKVSRSRRDERTVQFANRSVYVGYVFGRTTSGKTSLLSALASEGTGVIHGRSTATRVAFGRVQLDGQQVYLVLKEEGGDGQEQEFVGSSSCSDLCDVAVFCYDQSKSTQFQYVADLADQLVVPGPHGLMVATKADLPAAVQVSTQQPADFCAERDMSMPLQVSTVAPSDTTHPKELFRAAVVLAREPRATPRFAPAQPRTTSWLVPATAAVGVAIVAIVAYRWLKR
eukprot:m.35795 g.35795  ORF g.35795 m.35795 type:complete len:629 (-) comp9923_c0_seq1:153-2039(-)